MLLSVSLTHRQRKDLFRHCDGPSGGWTRVVVDPTHTKQGHHLERSFIMIISLLIVSNVCLFTTLPFSGGNGKEMENNSTNFGGNEQMQNKLPL